MKPIILVLDAERHVGERALPPARHTASRDGRENDRQDESGESEANYKPQGNSQFLTRSAGRRWAVLGAER